MFDEIHLNKTLTGLGLPEDDQLFAELHRAYTEDKRYYHNETHIADCLTLFQGYKHLAEHPAEIEIALWFHDAVYNTHRSDNEKKSAQWAENYLTQIGAGQDTVQRVVNMILATKTHKAQDRDCEILVDIDLAILGSSPETFEAYDIAIRKEYNWVPEKLYKKGRAKVLAEFLDRSSIFKTPELRSQLEEAARINISTKLVNLR